MFQEKWRKSSYSAGNPAQCVEVGATSGLRGVRDSKNPKNEVLIFPEVRFSDFLRQVRGNFK
ncbi:DUF397 domain-containing protein [Actinosynnema sp.]|uniref:DUF397 domain-containing protein n=1 Tax=Actinosynnema sp. TaxID=1872144 RepID=UPI003F865517